MEKTIFRAERMLIFDETRALRSFLRKNGNFSEKNTRTDEMNGIFTID